MQPSRHDHLLDTGVAVVLAVLAVLGVGGVLVGLVLGGVLPLNHDAGIYLQCAQLLLRGDLPYLDYVELNPPLTHYLHVVPVLAAQGFGAPLPMTFQVMVLGLTLASSVALFLVLQRSRVVASRSGLLLVLAGWLAASTYIYCDGGFGQREHLFLLGFAPWLALRESRFRGISFPPFPTAGLALVASLLILLKPHFVIIAGAAELWMLIRTRRGAAWRAPEVMVAAGVAVLYVSHFLLLPNEVRDAFFQRWIPLVADHYDVYNSSLAILLTRTRPFLMMVLAGTALALFAAYRASAQKLLLEGLVLSVLLGVGSFLLQQKGWSYQRYPAAGLLGLLIVVAVLVLLEKGAAHVASSLTLRAAWRPVVLMALLLGLALPVGHWAREAAAYGTYRKATVQRFVHSMRRHTGPGERVAFISTSVWPAYPSLIYAGRLPGTRYLCAFPIAFFYEGSPPGRGESLYHVADRQPVEERRFLEELGQDLLQHRPKLVYVSTGSCQACPPDFDIAEYLAHVGWQERFLEDYERIEQLDRYDVYLRKAQPSLPPVGRATGLDVWQGLSGVGR